MLNSRKGWFGAKSGSDIKEVNCLKPRLPGKICAGKTKRLIKTCW